MQHSRTPQDWARLAAWDERAEAAARAGTVNSVRNNWDWDRIIARVIDPARTIPHGERAQRY